jgi:hypothetical protein
LVYPNELEIKDTSAFDVSVSYLDISILLNIDSNSRLTNTLYDKRDDFTVTLQSLNFHINAVIHHFYLFMVCIEHVMRMRIFKARSTTDKNVDAAGL